MFNFLITLILIVASLLILVVLLQSSKKEGLGSALGDIGATQLIGVQKASDLLEQITWGLIIALFTLAMTISVVLQQEQRPSVSPNIRRVQEQISLPSIPEQTVKEAEKPAATEKAGK